MTEEELDQFDESFFRCKGFRCIYCGDRGFADDDYDPRFDNICHDCEYAQKKFWED